MNEKNNETNKKLIKENITKTINENNKKININDALKKIENNIV